MEEIIIYIAAGYMLVNAVLTLVLRKGGRIYTAVGLLFFAIMPFACIFCSGVESNYCVLGHKSYNLNSCITAHTCRNMMSIVTLVGAVFIFVGKIEGMRKREKIMKNTKYIIIYTVECIAYTISLIAFAIITTRTNAEVLLKICIS